MASHGVPRLNPAEESSAEARQEEQRKIEAYLELERLVHAKIREHEYTPETLQKISELLNRNPEYYTIWNYRRRILARQFSLAVSGDSDQPAADHIAATIKADLEFIFPLLRKFPKCYWIWNHRSWLLEEARRLLPAPVARRFWQEELALVGKMLSVDGRNFHGWGYRRFVVGALENFAPEKSMAQEELDYTTKMIKTNLSNFSAWHYRTKLIQKLLNEKPASDDERRKTLDDGKDTFSGRLCDANVSNFFFQN
ncbi:hypothetical protein M432DRAFT_625025 [Thermoascus aurantiacus ATCC 26904]